MSAAASGSLWLDRDISTSPEFTALQSDDEFDVVIIGGGIVGASLAMMLTEDDRSVALLEAGRIGGGITGNSTAKATVFQGTGFTRLIDALGVEDAGLVVDGDRAALDVMRNWASDGLISFIEEVDHWAYASTEQGHETLQQEMDAARELGIELRWAGAGDLPFGTHGLGMADQLLMEPAISCRTLAMRAARAGFTVAEHTRVTEVEPGDTITLTTADGAQVRAGAIVVATHVPILDRSLVFAACDYKRSHVIALELDDVRTQLPGMYTGVDSNGLSLRPAATRDGRDVVVIAGLGHSLGEDEDGTHLDELEAQARSLLGDRPGARTNAWLAHDAFPADGRPFVGPIRGNDNIYIATGFGGWGLARGVAASLALTGLIRRDHARWAPPLDARRLKPYVGTDTIKEGLATAKKFVGDRIDRTDEDQIDALAPGSGDVFRIGSRSVAVSRDAGGALHAVDATCTHMGCLVRFDAECDSWQCPCHGSRFATDGTVLAGPAIKPLERVDLQDERSDD